MKEREIEEFVKKYKQLQRDNGVLLNEIINKGEKVHQLSKKHMYSVILNWGLGFVVIFLTGVILTK